MGHAVSWCRRKLQVRIMLAYWTASSANTTTARSHFVTGMSCSAKVIQLGQTMLKRLNERPEDSIRDRISSRAWCCPKTQKTSRAAVFISCPSRNHKILGRSSSPTCPLTPACSTSHTARTKARRAVLYENLKFNNNLCCHNVLRSVQMMPLWTTKISRQLRKAHYEND